MIIKRNIVAKDKIDALRQIANIAEYEDIVSDSRLYLKGLLEREYKFSTGIGNNVAIPHCRCETIKEIFIIICTLENKIDWKSIDEQNVDFIIAFGIPNNNLDNEYLKIISRLAKNLIKEDFVKELKSLENEKEIINKIKSTIS